MSLYRGGKELQGLSKGTKIVTAIYIGAKLVWEQIKSCFSSGSWSNIKPWINKESWKN